MEMAKFFTRSKANVGAEVLLVLPDGTKTDKWIKVAGQDSDLYQGAFAEVRVKAVALSQAPADKEAEAKADYKKSVLEVVCKCVLDWNLDDELTLENVATLLTEAPQIKAQIETAIYDRKLFFVESSPS